VIEQWQAPESTDVTEESNSGLLLGSSSALATASTRAVSVTGMEDGLQSIAVRSAIDLIASLTSELPVHIYRGSGADRVRMPVPGNVEDSGGDGYGLQDWAYQVRVWWLCRGNAYGYVVARTPVGKYETVVLLHPDEVSGYYTADGTVQWMAGGKSFTSADRFMHARVNPVPGRVMGLSPIAFHAMQIGLSLTANAFGLDWFTQGAHPSSLLTNSETDLTEKQASEIKQRYMATVHGSREPLVFGRGWKHDQIQVTPEESQFLATQGYTEAQCARIFGPGVAEILGYESGGNLTYTNVESRSGHLLVYALNKWFCRYERLLGKFLPDAHYARIDRDALLQATTMERYAAHEARLKNFWATINEVRSDEDLPPVPWGDEPYFTSRMFTESQSTADTTSTSVSTTIATEEQ